MADMRTVSKALETYQIDQGHYPANGVTIAQLRVILIPYQVNVVPLQDHWQHDYSYASDGQNNYTLESYGKDGVDGVNISAATKWQFDRDIVLSNGFFVASPEL
jgi:hypothetical protein